MKNTSLLKNNFMCYIVIFQTKNNVSHRYYYRVLPILLSCPTDIIVRLELSPILNVERKLLLIF